MSASGPIIIIEDDPDDKEIFEEVLKELGILNKLVWLINAPDAFTYLKTTEEQPFLIICDINLPVQNGIEFKRQVDNDPQLRKKSIPFIFFTTAVQQSAVNEAYIHLTVQGFFQKSSNYENSRKAIKIIFDYWNLCRHPNSF